LVFTTTETFLAKNHSCGFINEIGPNGGSVPILAPSAYTEAMNPNAALTSRRYPVGYIGPVNGPYPTYGQSRRERCRHTSGRRVGDLSRRRM
jgi:hypothetical protein